MAHEPPEMAAHVTTLLLAWSDGQRAALEDLVPIVQRELRRLAQAAMAREWPGHTLQPTALVNEVYLHLVRLKSVRWRNRAHFFALARRLMRRILVDLARRKRYQKRGGRLRFVRLSEERLRAPDPGKDLAALEEALERLARIDPRCSRVVELRYFRGLSVEETATVIQVSRDTVMRDWAYARAWLLRELLPATPGSLRPRRSGSRPQHN